MKRDTRIQVLMDKEKQLQAIADAWNELSAGYKIWVEPELAVLLDALSNEP